MNGLKRLMLPVLMAVGLLALAIPAVAGATTFESPLGKPVAVGTEVAMTSTNTIWESSLGTTSCKKFTINAQVTKNSGSTARVVGNGVSTASECFVEETNKITIQGFTLTNLESTTAGTGTASFSFEELLPASIVCKNTATNVPFSFVDNTNVIHFQEVELTSSPSICGEEFFTADFALTKASGGAPILLH